MEFRFTLPRDIYVGHGAIKNLAHFKGCKRIMYPYCAYAVSEKYGETGERYVRTHRRNAWARGY